MRHAPQRNNAPANAPAPEEEAPPAPPVPTAAVTVPAPAPPAAAPALTVESSTPVPMPPRRAIGRRVAVAAAPEAAPAPEPAARPSDDKPSGTRCEGGTVRGERLSVQGVAADDVLNVREAPDKSAAVLGGLPPDATGVHGTSNRKRVGQSVWREVECGKLRGWVNERFLARETGSE